MKTAFPISSALTLVLTSSLAAAQAQPPGGPLAVDGLRLGSSDPLLQSFRRVTGARMSTSFDADIISLSSSVLTFFFQPGRFDSKTEFFVTENDLAIVPGGDLDYVFTSGSAGLTQWYFNEPLGVYESLVINTAWSNVTRMQVGSNGTLNGLDPVSGIIRRYDPDGPTTFSDGDGLPPLIASRDAIDFVLLDWDFDKVEDFVMQTTTDIIVFKGETTTKLWKTPTTSPEDRIGAVLGTKIDPDILVWGAKFGENWYMRSQNSANLNDGIIALGPAFNGEFHGADVQPGLGAHSNECQELLLSADNLQTFVFRRTIPLDEKNPPQFLLAPDLANFYSTLYQHDAAVAPPQFAMMGSGGGAGGIVSGSADIDQDGDLEPIFARSEDGLVSFQYDGYYPDDHIIASFGLNMPLSGAPELTVQVLNLGNAPGFATHLMAEVWRHDSAGSSESVSETFEPQLVARESVSLQELSPAVFGSVTLDLDEVGLHQSTDVYHVALRAVRITNPATGPRTTASIAEDPIDMAWQTYAMYASQDQGSLASTDTWPGTLALSTQQPDPTPQGGDPIKTGGGSQAGRGTSTTDGPPPIGGSSHSGSTGS